MSIAQQLWLKLAMAWVFLVLVVLEQASGRILPKPWQSERHKVSLASEFPNFTPTACLLTKFRLRRAANIGRLVQRLSCVVRFLFYDVCQV